MKDSDSLKATDELDYQQKPSFQHLVVPDASSTSLKSWGMASSPSISCLWSGSTHEAHNEVSPAVEKALPCQ